jgi:ankyrin repeat protein
MFYLTNNYNNLTRKLCQKNISDDIDNIDDINVINLIGGRKRNKKIKDDSDSNSNSEDIDENELLDLLGKKEWEEIIRKYKNPRDVKINGNNLLHLACARGEVKVINYYLLKYPELFYIANTEGDTCAHILVKYGFFDILKSFLPKYPEVINFINKSGDSLLDLTIKEPEIMSWIINLMNPEYFEEMDASKISSLKSMIELIKLNQGKDLYLMLLDKLIKKGFKLNSLYPYSPMIVASKLDKPLVADLLLKAGANPNIRDKLEKTPLIYAVENSSYETTKQLLEYDADINYAGAEGDDLPLNIALKNKDGGMVDLLLTHENSKNKIKYDFKDRNLDTPIHIALKNNLINPFLKPSSLYKLIYESNLNAQNIKQITPMHLLARSNKINLKNYTQILKNKDLNLEIKDYKNKTPVQYLSRENKNIFEISENSIIENSIIENSIIESSDVKMPKLKQNNLGLFNSDILHNAIYTAMILRKYKKLGIPTQKYSLEEFNKSYNKFNYLANYKSREGKLVQDIISIYYENFYQLLPYLFLWKSRDLYYFNSKIKEEIKKLMKNDKIRFIMMKLSLIPNYNSTHANILIYDKKTNVLERFEPYGPNEMLDELELNKFLERICKKIFNKKIKFISPKLFMEDAKFQIVSSDSDPDNKKIGDPIGYCLAWCFWYLELRINNPDISSKELVNNAFINILNKQSLDSNQVLDYIRNYSHELDKLKNIFLKECGIQEKYFYNNTFDNKDTEKILHKLSKEFN